ncbi:MAG: VWA domain-containing protein [Kofleriaceae bacterium]
MVPHVAHRVCTSFTLAAATATVLAALLLHGRTSCPAPTSDDSGMELAARLTDGELVVLVTAPNRAATRPPISLVVALDASSSMSGEPLAQAKAAAVRLVDQLEPGDAFSIITFSSASAIVMPTAMASDPNKAAARAAIGGIFVPEHAAGTCLACGLDQAVSALARSPIVGGVNRIIVLSDGDPNIGIGANAQGNLAPIRDEADVLAASIARRGISVSSVGVGLDFNEALMTNLAAVGHGNYYFVEDTQDLAMMFGREIESIARTVASDVKLVVTDGAGVTIEEAYGYPLTRTGEAVVVPIADLRAGETRKVVLRVSTHPRRVAPTVKLGWRWVDTGLAAHAATTATPLVVPGPRPTAPRATRSSRRCRPARSSGRRGSTPRRVRGPRSRSSRIASPPCGRTRSSALPRPRGSSVPRPRRSTVFSTRPRRGSARSAASTRTSWLAKISGSADRPPRGSGVP